MKCLKAETNISELQSQTSFLNKNDNIRSISAKHVCQILLFMFVKVTACIVQNFMFRALALDLPLNEKKTKLLHT